MSDLWAVWRNTDDTEGRGREYVDAICQIEATAIRYGRKRYVQGGDCPVEKFSPVLVDGAPCVPLKYFIVQQPSADDVKLQASIDAKRAAIAKAKASGLSEDEIAAIQGRGMRHE
jgi:hypothetical protein